MLKSMTGFGRTSVSNALCELKVEIKTVNSKYCDINMRLPKSFSFVEIPLRALIQEHLMRGKVDMLVEARFHKPLQTLALNRRNFISCLNVLEQIKTLGGLNDEIQIAHLLHFQDIYEYDTVMDTAEIEEFIKAAVLECIKKVDDMRAVEGKNLTRKIKSLLNEIDILAHEVDVAKNDVFLYWVNRFKTKVEEFLPNSSDYNERIIQEASIYAEKADIKEELTRINSHQKQFLSIIEKEYPNGKKLDFLCQEMYREWNTIASKSIKTEIINAVVQAKATVDSIREQIQNVV